MTHEVLKRIVEQGFTVALTCRMSDGTERRMNVTSVNRANDGAWEIALKEGETEYVMRDKPYEWERGTGEIVDELLKTAMEKGNA